MTGIVRTVTGDVPAGDLGRMLMHEHVLCDLTHPTRRDEPETPITLENAFAVRYHWDRHVGNHRLGDPDVAGDELRLLADAGGGGLVELTCGGIRPNPEGLRQAALASGLQMVMGCGYYTADYAGTELTSKGIEAIAREMVDAVTIGAWGTEVRSGIIGEIGLSDPWHPAERRALEAAALAQSETGTTVNVHPGRNSAAASEIVRVFAAAGGDVTRLVISHMDRTFVSVDGPARLADMGCVVEYDFFGIEQSYYPYADLDMPHDAGRLDLVRGLIDRGHLERIAVSQDICTKTRLTRWGGHGYAHILNNVVPMMLRKDFTDDEIETLLVGTPRRLLTLAA
ncbi:MAG: aryldialkylphosphatase [Hyphomicrobiales bacterium]|nr:aryldialkylphosphatase [Hyphomicrobiales bacterium]